MPTGLLLTLLAVLVASVLSLVVTEVSVENSTKSAARIAKVLERLDSASDLKGHLLDVETSQRGFQLTEDSAFLRPFESAVRAIPPTLERLRSLTTAGDTKTPVDDIAAVVDERVGISNTIVALVEHGQRAEALNIVRGGHGMAVMDEFRGKLRELEIAAEGELVAARQRESEANMWPRFAVLVSAVLIIGLLMVVTRLFVHDALQQRLAARASEQEAERLKQLVEARTLELSELSSHLQTMTEREKGELARNLHDELGGLLTAARMDISWLQGATKLMDQEIAARLDQLNSAFIEAMDVKRRVVESLRPALLDHFGLPTALQNYFDVTCKQAGLNCKATIPEDMAELPQDLAIALYRVGQESLTNIIRHAKAKNVEMSIDAVDDMLHVRVRDDGAGIDLASPFYRASHGMTGMRHRIQSLGGTFELVSTPGGGTEIRISVPRAAAQSACSAPAGEPACAPQ